MAILGTGIDLASVPRIARMRAEHGEHFLRRCFTAAEQAYCLGHRDSDERFAGRFAAKEAVMKVLGTGWRGQIAWTDMEVLNDPAGKPLLTLRDECHEIARKMGIVRWHVSITHTADLAIASAIGEG